MKKCKPISLCLHICLTKWSQIPLQVNERKDKVNMGQIWLQLNASDNWRTVFHITVEEFWRTLLCRIVLIQAHYQDFEHELSVQPFRIEHSFSSWILGSRIHD